MRWLVLLACLLGCGSGGSDPPRVRFQYDTGGIREIWLGRRLLTTGCGAYVIGDCPGFPDDGGAPTTCGANGVMTSNHRCAPAPFTFSVLGRTEKSIHVRWDIGPLPEDYWTLSAPLDMPESLMDSFGFFPDHGARTGGCNQWRVLTGRRYADIWLACNGLVGLAESLEPATSAEAEEERVLIRRRVLDSSGVRASFYAHNPLEVRNIEWQLGAPRRGQVIWLEEVIEVEAK